MDLPQTEVSSKSPSVKNGYSSTLELQLQPTAKGGGLTWSRWGHPDVMESWEFGLKDL